MIQVIAIIPGNSVKQLSNLEWNCQFRVDHSQAGQAFAFSQLAGKKVGIMILDDQDMSKMDNAVDELEEKRKKILAKIHIQLSEIDKIYNKEAGYSKGKYKAKYKINSFAELDTLKLEGVVEDLKGVING